MIEKEKQQGTAPKKEKREDSSIAMTFITIIVVALSLLLIYYIFRPTHIEDTKIPNVTQTQTQPSNNAQ